VVVDVFAAGVAAVVGIFLQLTSIWQQVQQQSVLEAAGQAATRLPLLGQAEQTVTPPELGMQ
jgi:hypothetical protein